MTKYVDLTKEQESIISKIKKTSLYEGYKTVFLVIMSTNNFIRTSEDLAKILSEYGEMPDYKEIEKIISECTDNNLLVSSENYGETYYFQNKECLDRFLLNYPEGIKKDIYAYRRLYANTESVRILGLLSGENEVEIGYNHASFLQRLNDAQSEILLPMLNTTPNRKVLEILKAKSNQGVKVKILLPDFQKVVKKIRAAKDDRTKIWMQELSGYSNIEIRLYSHIEEANIYSSVIVDNEICRITVFDYIKEKSSNGTLIELQKNGYNLNLIEIIRQWFFEIWNNARPSGESAFISVIKSKLFCEIIILIILLVLIILLSGVIQNILVGVFGTILVVVFQKICNLLVNAFRAKQKKKG